MSFILLFLAVTWLNNKSYAASDATSYDINDDYFSNSQIYSENRSNIIIWNWQDENSNFWYWVLVLWAWRENNVDLKKGSNILMCHKQLNWYFVINFTNFLMLPLDSQTLNLISWPLFNWTVSVIEWWLFYDCDDTEVNWVYWYIKWQYWENTHEIRAWLDSNDNRTSDSPLKLIYATDYSNTYRTLSWEIFDSLISGNITIIPRTMWIVWIENFQSIWWTINNPIYYVSNDTWMNIFTKYSTQNSANMARLILSWYDTNWQIDTYSVDEEIPGNILKYSIGWIGLARPSIQKTYSNGNSIITDNAIITNKDFGMYWHDSFMYEKMDNLASWTITLKIWNSTTTPTWIWYGRNKSITFVVSGVNCQPVSVPEGCSQSKLVSIQCLTWNLHRTERYQWDNWNRTTENSFNVNTMWDHTVRVKDFLNNEKIYTYNVTWIQDAWVSISTTVTWIPESWTWNDITVTFNVEVNDSCNGTNNIPTNTYYCIYNEWDSQCNPTTQLENWIDSIDISCEQWKECKKYIRYYSRTSNNSEEINTSDIILIDKKWPTCEVPTYDPPKTDGCTNWSVTANLSAIDTWAWIDDPNSIRTWFTENWSRSYTFTDKVWNNTSCTASVDWIYSENDGPVTTANWIPEDWTWNDVNIAFTVDTNNACDGWNNNVPTTTYYCVYNSWDVPCTPTTTWTSLQITCNSDSICEQYVIYYSEIDWWPAESQKIELVRIDKKAPTCDGVSYYESSCTNNNVTATFTVNDLGAWLSENNDNDLVFNENGTRSGTFTDKVWNSTICTATVDWIDKLWPTFTLEDTTILECSTWTLIITWVRQVWCANESNTPYKWWDSNFSNNNTYSRSMNTTWSISIQATVQDAFQNYTEQTGTITWTDAVLTANDFEISKTCWERTINWKELSNAEAWSCEEITAIIKHDWRKWHCEFSPSNDYIKYTPNNNTVWDDTCVIEITDGDTKKDITITRLGINSTTILENVNIWNITWIHITQHFVTQNLFELMDPIGDDCNDLNITLDSIQCDDTIDNYTLIGNTAQLTPNTNIERTGYCIVTFIDEGNNELTGKITFYVDTIYPTIALYWYNENSCQIWGSNNIIWERNETVLWFNINNVNITNWTIDWFIDNNPIFTWNLINSQDNWAYWETTISIPQNTITDNLWNPNTSNIQLTLWYDNAAPNKPMIDPNQSDSCLLNNAITVKTNIVSDNGCSNSVKYQFCKTPSNNTNQCTAANISQWTTDTWYTFTSLQTNTTYYFFVRAKDDLNNITEWSPAYWTIESLQANSFTWYFNATRDDTGPFTVTVNRKRKSYASAWICENITITQINCNGGTWEINWDILNFTTNDNITTWTWLYDETQSWTLYCNLIITDGNTTKDITWTFQIKFDEIYLNPIIITWTSFIQYTPSYYQLWSDRTYKYANSPLIEVKINGWFISKDANRHRYRVSCIDTDTTSWTEWTQYPQDHAWWQFQWNLILGSGCNEIEWNRKVYVQLCDSPSRELCDRYAAQ